MTTSDSPIATLDRLPRDLRTAAATLGRSEARYLVDLYYTLQEDRKRAANQVRSMTDEEPHATIEFFANQFVTVERQIKGALDTYSDSDPLGSWARGHVGIGPVIAAGLIAHIDIAKAPTVGHIWRYAGLDPTTTWGKGQKRPWNAQLKTLCWKIGDSMVKFSGREDCFYGQIYKQRKEYEINRDIAGGHADEAKRALEHKKWKKKDVREIYESGHLPAGHLDARARRYAVKLFLAHYFEEGYRQHHGTEPPLPYPIAHLDHTHKIEAPDPV